MIATETDAKLAGSNRAADARRRQALAAAIDAGDADAVAQLLDGAAASAIADALEAMEPGPRRSAWRQIGPDADSVAVRPGDTLAQAAQAIRQHCAEHGRLPAHLDSLMVTHEDDRFLGRVDVADLLVHDNAQEVRAHLRTAPGPINVAMPADDVARRFGDLNLVSAAVVDAGGRLLGRITVDDVVDVLRRQAERSQLLNLLAGELAGTCISMGLERLGVDPARAGGVVLVAMSDAFGFGVFLGLGSWLLL